MHRSVMETRLQNPVTVLVAGPTSSGKTCLVKRLLEQSKDIFVEPPQRILWCYGVYQNTYSEMQTRFPNMVLHEGLPDNLGDYFDGKQAGCLVLDDLMFSGTKSEKVCKVFTESAHHLNIAVFLLVQNLFHGGDYFRCMSLNCRYIILMRNNREKSQVVNLGKQIFPQNTRYLKEAYEDSIKLSKYGYLLIDLNNEDECMRLRTQVFPGEMQYVYICKNN